MKKILSVVAIAAFASSGAVFAQKVEPVLVNPATVEGAQNRVYSSSDPAVAMSEPRAVASAVTGAPVVAAPSAFASVEPGPVLVGNVKGPIKLGGPKYDPQGRKIYASRPIGR